MAYEALLDVHLGLIKFCQELPSLDVLEDQATSSELEGLALYDTVVWLIVLLVRI